MTRKSAFILIAIFYSLGYLGQVAFGLGIDFPAIPFLANYGIVLANLTAIVLMLAYGTLWKAKTYKYFLCFLVFLFIVGLWFEVSQFEVGNLIIIISCISAAITYAVFFLQKTPKKWSDYLKVIWAILAFCLLPFCFLDIIDRNWMQIPNIVFMFLLAVFFFEEWKKDKMQDNEG